MHWLRREALLFAVIGGFGLLVLPALIYFVGLQLLGEYRPGAGMGAFYADLYGQLATLSIWAWLLVLGPWLAIQMLRLFWLPAGTFLGQKSGPSHEDDDEESADAVI